jgi:hypothetical protein
LSINSIPSSSQWRLESEWNEEKRTHDANGHTHFSIESCLLFYYFDFSISRRDQVATREFSSNVKLPRPPSRLVFDCLMPVSQSVMTKRKKKRKNKKNKKKNHKVKEYKEWEWHPLKKADSKRRNTVSACVCVYIKIVLCSSLFFRLGRGAAVEINSRLHVSHTHTHTRLNIIEKFPLSLSLSLLTVMLLLVWDRVGWMESGRIRNLYAQQRPPAANIPSWCYVASSSKKRKSWPFFFFFAESAFFGLDWPFFFCVSLAVRCSS